MSASNLTAPLRTLATTKPDVIVVVSPPPFNGIAACDLRAIDNLPNTACYGWCRQQRTTTSAPSGLIPITPYGGSGRATPRRS